MQKNLTRQEQKILNLFFEGLIAKEIADKLDISVRTVDFHRTNIFRKLKVQNINELLINNKNNQDRESVVIAETTSPVNGKKFWFLIAAGIVILTVFGSIIYLVFFEKLITDVPVIVEPTIENITTSLATPEKPLVISLFSNPPWGYNHNFDLFVMYNYIITEGDIYNFSYSFTSSHDFDMMNVFLADKTVEEDDFFTWLSVDIDLILHGIAGIEYSGSRLIFATKSSNTIYNSSLLHICTLPYTDIQPTLTFTKFEVTKIK
jgi:DNA-binding CsgD family transcriptional regulator